MHFAGSSVVSLAMAPLRDLFNLGREARMDVPGQAAANWRRRRTDDLVSGSRFDWLRDLTPASNRPDAPA